MKKILFLLPLVLALNGCSGGSESAAPNLDMMAQASVPASRASFDARPRQIAIGSTLAHLPEGAGAPRLARDRHYPNGYWQEIILSTDAASVESEIDLAIQTGKPLTSNEKAPVWKPGEAGIQEELARHFPNMPMQVVANGGYANQYGRFGLAMGRQGESLRCIYAWQYIDDARQSFAGGGHIPLDGVSRAPAALRVKLCRADATIDELVDHVRHLSVVIPENFGTTEEIAATATRPVALNQTPKKRKRTTASTARALREREFDAAPPSYAAAPPSYAPAPSAPYAPQAYGGAPYKPSMTAEGPRYMAPTEAPLAAAPSRTVSTRLSPDLPPQAYRGPGALHQPDALHAPAPNSYQ